MQFRKQEQRKWKSVEKKPSRNNEKLNNRETRKKQKKRSKQASKTGTMRLNRTTFSTSVL